MGWLAAGLAGAAVPAGLLLAPADAVQGQAQRLMYLHVPAAWTAYLAFGAVLVTGAGYLHTGDLRWDRCARVAAEIGVALTAVTIAVGALWGRVVWGAWWAWDPRLVSTVLLLLVYIGQLALRGAVADPGRHRVPTERDARRAARWAALAGIAGFVLVPVVHFSVVWWRSLHQPATVLAPHRPPIDALMAAALLLSLAAVTTAACWVFLHRLAALEEKAAATPDAPSAVETPSTRDPRSTPDGRPAAVAASR